MVRRQVSLLCLALALSSLAVSAFATVITVSPATPSGWTWTATNDGRGFFSNAGPAVDEGQGFASGSGAFFGRCAQISDSNPVTPSTVWLGTDQVNGQSLVDITLPQIKKLQYSTYVPTNYTKQGGSGERKYCNEPFMFTLTFFKAAGNYGDRRQLWFRPWLSSDPGLQPPVKGDEYNFGNHLGHWETWDCLDPAQGIWYEHWTNYWTGTWDDATARWATGHLVPTSTYWNPTDYMYGYKSAGFDTSATIPPGDPRATGTGTCLNFWVGARQSVASVFTTPNYAWWQESYNFRGYVDNFTIGVDFNKDGDATDPGEEVTYDFESSLPAADVVAMPCKLVYEKVAQRNTFHRFRYKIWGIVQADPAPTANSFVIWDGTYATIEKGDSTYLMPATFLVKTSSHEAYPGEWVSVIGGPWQKFYQSPETPAEFYSNPSDINVLYEPE